MSFSNCKVRKLCIGLCWVAWWSANTNSCCTAHPVNHTTSWMYNLPASRTNHANRSTLCTLATVVLHSKKDWCDRGYLTNQFQWNLLVILNLPVFTKFYLLKEFFLVWQCKECKMQCRWCNGIVSSVDYKWKVIPYLQNWQLTPNL